MPTPLYGRCSGQPPPPGLAGAFDEHQARLRTASSCAEPVSVRRWRPFVLHTESVSFSLSTAVSKGNGGPPAKGTERGSPTPWVASSSGVALSDHGREPQAEDGTQGHFKCRGAQAQMSSAPRRLGCTNLCNWQRQAVASLPLQPKGMGHPWSAGASPSPP